MQRQTGLPHRPSTVFPLAPMLGEGHVGLPIAIDQVPACFRAKKGTLNQRWCMLSEQGHGNQAQGAGTPQAVAAPREQMAQQGQPHTQQVRNTMFFV